MGRAHPDCVPNEHTFYRRQFLGTMGAGTAAIVPNLNPLTGLCSELAAQQTKRRGKSLIVIYLGGGWSQFETWDPKPGQPTGGPYGAIPTSVPGLHISELLPGTAGIMHHLAVVRSISNGSLGGNHDGGGVLIGRPLDKSVTYPTLAEIATRVLHDADSQLPYHVELQTNSVFRYESTAGVSALGPRYAPLVFSTTEVPPLFYRMPELSELDHHDREQLRSFLSRNFLRRHHVDRVEAYNQSHARVRGLMACDSLLDVEQAPQEDLERYGTYPLARHCLSARRLVEAGVPVVKIRDTWWDTHADCFEGHHALCTNFDHAFSTLIQDLVERDMLKTTLVVTLSEFGRKPTIGADLGRDHYPATWSAVMAGCGVHGGAIVGRTNEDGTEIVERKVSPTDLFASYFHALDIDPEEDFYVQGRPIPMLEHGGKVIEELFT